MIQCSNEEFFKMSQKEYKKCYNKFYGIKSKNWGKIMYDEGWIDFKDQKPKKDQYILTKSVSIYVEKHTDDEFWGSECRGIEHNDTAKYWKPLNEEKVKIMRTIIESSHKEQRRI